MANVQSVERAFAILEEIANHNSGIGVTKIARNVDLPKSTVSRLLSTLECVKAVERLADNDGFQIGEGILNLAASTPYPRQLISIARPYLLELAEVTGETVNLCLPDGDQVHYIDQVDSQYHLQIQDWTGYRFPLHVTSNGKIFLAYWSEEALAQYVSRPLQSYATKTITTPEVLRQELAQIRSQGYAWAKGESEEEIVGIAAPVQDKTGQVIASVCAGGPAFRFPPEGKWAEMSALVVEIGQKISARIAEWWKLEIRWLEIVLSYLEFNPPIS